MNARHASHVKTIGSAILLVLALALGLLILSTPAFAEAPGNDNFADATVIGSLPYSDYLYTGEATADPADPLCGGANATVWYSYQPDYDLTLSISTWGGYYATDYETSVSVHTYDGAAFSTVGCAANSSEQPLVLDATAGTTYYFMVSAWGAGGNLYLSVDGVVTPPPPEPPVNDDFDNAIEIPGLPYLHENDVQSATTDGDDPATCGSVERTVWYKYQASESGWLQASTLYSYYEAGIAVFTGTRGMLEQVACAPTHWSQPLRFPVTEGVTYYFMIADAWGGGVYLHFTLDVATAPPANDDFDSAAVIETLPYEAALDTTPATTALDDPYCSGNGATVWYVLTAPADMRIEADTFGSNYDTTLSVWTGQRGTLNQITCNDDYYGVQSYISFDVAAGETYYIMVGRFGSGSGGDMQLHVQELYVPPPPANDDFDSATDVVALPFGETLDVASATRAGDDPYPGCGGWDRTVWYAYTPTETMWLEADPYGGTNDVSIAVYTGPRGALTEVACRSDWYMGEPLRFLAQGGTTYYFMLSPTWESTWLAFNLRAGPTPPPNDDINDATVITALPYSESVDATNATGSWDDPPCGWYPSVWYAFTPDRDMRLEAVIDNGAYIAVAMGSPGNLTPLTCMDSWSMPLRLDVQAGVTYYIMLSVPTYYGNITNFTLQEAPPPLSVTVTVDPTATFRQDGSATVTGTITCSRPADGYVSVFLRQPVGRVNVIQGGSTVYLSCDGTTTWSVTITPWNGKFAGGPAEATVDAFIQDGYDGASANLVVPLTLNRAKK